MINTIFYFVDDENFDYGQAIDQGAISPYTIVFDKPKKRILMGGKSFGQMSREDIAAELLSSGNISDLLPVATDLALGGIKIGFVSDTDSSSRKYGVKLDENDRAYVQVPWTDTITPEYDDSALRELIQSQRTRIDNYISNLTTVIQQKTEQLLDDAEWVTNNLEQGETGRQILDDVDRYMRQYGVWEPVDENDPSKGRVIKTSVIEQKADSIDLRVGAIEDYNDGELATALSNISQTVGVDLATGQTIANTGLTSSVADLNKETGAIDRAIISALDLKAEKSNGTYEAITDLSSVYSDNTKSLYSGLNTRVSNVENDLQAESSLMSRVLVKNGNNYEVQNDIISGVVNSATFTNGVATATSTLSSAVNDTIAAVETKVSKDANGKLESTVKLSAQLIYLQGDTFANSVFAGSVFANKIKGDIITGDYIKGKVAEVGYLKAGDLSAINGSIENLNTLSVRIENKANNALNSADNANDILMELSGGNGKFKGDVEARTLIAGDPNGINIRTSSDKIEFCQGGDIRAYFVANGKGMQLHVWDADGVEHVIDFTSGTFIQVNSGGATYNPVRTYKVYNGSSGFVDDTNLYKGADGKYYEYSNSSYSLVTSREVYIKESVNTYPVSGTPFSGSYIPMMFKNSSNNGIPVAVSVMVDRYIKYTITNGVLGSASSNYTYYAPEYPISINYNSETSATVATAGRFVNPIGSTTDFQYICHNGTLKNLGQPMKNFTCVGQINSKQEYTTNPRVYDINWSNPSSSVGNS